jgi:hypothetical protein
LAGLTFQQRDNAATYLVRNGEAAYRDLRCLGCNATTAHIVALQNLEEVERLVAEHRWAGVPE